jgi:hypothetical protein
MLAVACVDVVVALDFFSFLSPPDFFKTFLSVDIASCLVLQIVRVE